MIAYLVLSAAIGALVALCVERLIPRAKPTSLMPNEAHQFSAVSIDATGRGGAFIDAHYVRTLKKLGLEV
jgi:hypothetical protein